MTEMVVMTEVVKGTQKLTGKSPTWKANRLHLIQTSRREVAREELHVIIGMSPNVKIQTLQQDASLAAKVLTSTSRNLLMRRKLQQVLHSTSQQMMTDRCNYGKVSRSTAPNIERDFIISRTSFF